MGQKTSEGSRIQNSNNSYGIPSKMDGKCLKFGKYKQQHGQQCSAGGQKCKNCGKLGHFARVCLRAKKQQQRMVGNVQVPEGDDGTFVDETGRTQPNSQCQRINMVKLINSLKKQGNGVQTQIPEKNLKFSIVLDPWKTFEDQIIMKWTQVQTLIALMRTLLMHFFLK